MPQKGTSYGRRIDSLREQATKLGISKEQVRQHGNLAKLATWERAIAAHPPAPKLPALPETRTAKELQPPRIICPTCLGKHADICQRCLGTGKIFNLVRFRAGYVGEARLPMGVLR